MIYCKSLADRSCELRFEGDGGTVLDEIATLLAALHRDVWNSNPEKAGMFRHIMREMTEKGSMVWQIEGNNPEEDPCEPASEPVMAHYERLCRAAEHFGLEAQKQKAKEEMTELSALLRDYMMPDKLLRGHRIEEIADVYNMLDQLCILWNCEDEVQDVAEQKMIRTMERIESGYYDEG